MQACDLHWFVGLERNRIFSGSAQRPVDLLPVQRCSTHRRASAGHNGGRRQPWPKVKRNEPCPCGSGIKSKYCNQPHAFVDVKVLPLDLCQIVVNDLVGTTEAEMRDLFDQLLYLPELDASLQVRLRGIITPEVERVRSTHSDATTMRSSTGPSTRSCRPSTHSIGESSQP